VSAAAVESRRGAVLAAFAAAAFAAVLWGLASGSEPIGFSRLLRIFAGAESGVHAQIVLGLRLPRVLAAFAAGGLLALAGALMQILLRNPLADPYVLGLAGGAGTGALAAMLFGLPSVLVVAGAWGGAAASVLLVAAFARTGQAVGPVHAIDEPLRLLLVGVALATGWGAAITLILALAPDASLRGMLFWLMGDIDGAESFAAPWLALAALCAGAVLLGRDCNVLLQGAEVAHTLGVDVRRLRFAIMLLASVATAFAVTTVGTIGFVGLIVPNAVRLVLGNDQRLLIPAAVLGGGALLVAADTLARTLAAPIELPVGAVMALLGVPAFVWLVVRRRERV
jgi:iron complex transport system permease protein